MILLMSRKGAWWMLLVAVLWSALPASACLLAGQARMLPACCRGMESNCPMQSAGIRCICSPAHQDSAVVPLEASAPATQSVAFLPRSANSLIWSVASAKGQPELAVPPFDPSPGGFSILRI